MTGGVARGRRADVPLRWALRGARVTHVYAACSPRALRPVCTSEAVLVADAARKRQTADWSLAVEQTPQRLYAYAPAAKWGTHHLPRSPLPKPNPRRCVNTNSAHTPQHVSFFLSCFYMATAVRVHVRENAP